MSRDLTCACVPASTVSAARIVAGVSSSVTSIANRVTVLEETVIELDARIDDLEGLSVDESPFIIVDNEDELDAALLVGKHILLRGEGNAGVIEITSMKTVAIPGTKIWGYGYKSGGTDHFSRIKCNFPAPKVYGAPFPDVAFYVQASKCEFAGFELEGTDANDLVYASYIAFMLSPFHTLEDVSIHDVKAYNLHWFVAKTGFQGATVTRRLRVERNKVNAVVSYGVYLRESVYDSFIRDNVITLREDGDPATFVAAQGMHLLSDINNCVIDGNLIRNPNDMGIEFISVAYTPTVFQPMHRNHITNNRIINAGQQGISTSYCKDLIIHANTIDGAVGIGIESANGSNLGENSSPHNAIITNNHIRNVTSATYANGITSEQTVGDIVKGNRIEGITSDFIGAGSYAYVRAILLYRSRQVMVADNIILKADGCGILMQDGGVDTAEAQHVVQGNMFRVTEDETKAEYAILTQSCSSVIRNNVSYEPVSQIAKGKFRSESAAVVRPGFAWTADATANADFTESNLVITY